MKKGPLLRWYIVPKSLRLSLKLTEVGGMWSVVKILEDVIVGKLLTGMMSEPREVESDTKRIRWTDAIYDGNK